MNLEKKHMLENNRTCMILGFLIQAFMFAATILYREGRAFPTVVMLIVEVICLIVSIVGYMKLGQHAAGHYPLLISLAVDYLFVLFGSFHTPYLWAFGALIGMVVIVYDDLHICKLACICALSENAIFVIIYYVAGFAKASASRFMVPSNMAFVVIFIIICYQVSVTNSRQRTESLEDIERNQAEIEQKTAIIADTSEKISVKLEDADVAMAGLSEKVQASAEAVEQISSSVTMTAEAIQTQTEMNANITKSLDNISNESNEMEALAGVVKENVSEGNVIITELQKQAEETASVNKQTMAMTNELAKSAETVQEIVSAILTISNQTNLLALNASIEAARAGEAGKGFAVVADEIRKLSEDTKKSAEMISSTISDLKKSVDTASENMGASVESANKQGELIKETGSKFNDILVSVNELAKNVEKIADNVHECAEATSKVTDAISDLSAMSEEVAASSESSLTLSNACVEDMNTTNAILEEILKLSRQS